MATKRQLKNHGECQPWIHKPLQAGAPGRNREVGATFVPMSLWFMLVIYRTSYWDYGTH